MTQADELKYIIYTAHIKRLWQELEDLYRFDYSRDEVAAQRIKNKITELHELRGALPYE